MENTDLIREKIDIADFVRQYVELRPAGKNLKGLCPFHKEKSGSFMVNRDRQIWKCFGCGAGGDIFSFLMKYENIEFIEALKVLADKAGVLLKNIGTPDQKKYDVLYEINRIAKDYFRSNLFEPSSAPALSYLKDRGLTDITTSEFELGLAPATSDGLMRHLTKMGYAVGDIERAGLAFKTDRGTYWDRFRNRIMFPLHNHFGKVIGFTGRVMPGQESADIGKYVNSPETPIFNKSKLLFGFFKSKNFVREQGTAVLIEGQMDFLMAWQDGVKNLVATSGTALTAEHLKLLRRLAENLILSFDNDSAGKAAAERTIDLAQQEDFNVKVIQFDDPALKDPADLARTKPGHFAELIAASIPAMEYYFSYYGINNPAMDIAAKKKAIRQTLAKIKAIASPVEQQHWLTRITAMTGFGEQILLQEMAAIKIDLKPGRSIEHKIEQLGPISRQVAISQRLLGLALRDQATYDQVAAAAADLTAEYQTILPLLKPGSTITIPGPYIALVNLLYLQSGFEPGKNEVASLLSELHKGSLEQESRLLQQSIQQAESSKNSGLVAELLEKYRNLTQRRREG